jgi:aquaporin Z
MRTPAMSSRLGAEALGTFWLVFGGCGSAIFAAKYLAPNVVAGQSIQLSWASGSSGWPWRSA